MPSRSFPFVHHDFDAAGDSTRPSLGLFGFRLLLPPRLFWLVVVHRGLWCFHLTLVVDGLHCGNSFFVCGQSIGYGVGKHKKAKQIQSLLPGSREPTRQLLSFPVPDGLS